MSCNCCWNDNYLQSSTGTSRHRGGLFCRGSWLTSGADVALAADRLMDVAARALVALVEEAGAPRTDVLAAGRHAGAAAAGGAAFVLAGTLVVDGALDGAAGSGAGRHGARARLGQVCDGHGTQSAHQSSSGHDTLSQHSVAVRSVNRTREKSSILTEGQ